MSDFRTLSMTQSMNCGKIWTLIYLRRNAEDLTSKPVYILSIYTNKTAPQLKLQFFTFLSLYNFREFELKFRVWVSSPASIETYFNYCNILGRGCTCSVTAPVTAPVVCGLLRSVINCRKSIVNIRGFHLSICTEICWVALVEVVTLLKLRMKYGSTGVLIKLTGMLIRLTRVLIRLKIVIWHLSLNSNSWNEQSFLPLCTESFIWDLLFVKFIVVIILQKLLVRCHLCGVAKNKWMCRSVYIHKF